MILTGVSGAIGFALVRGADSFRLLSQCGIGQGMLSMILWGFMVACWVWADRLYPLGDWKAPALLGAVAMVLGGVMW